MNSAKRIEQILLKIKSSKENQALKVFEEVFGVDGCVAVSNKLRLCHTQIDVMREGSHDDLIKYLVALFNCGSLNRDINNERENLDTYIITLHTAGHYMNKEVTNKESVLELSELLIEMEDKFNKIDLSDQHKEVIEQYINEISEAIIDLDIGGTKAFENHVIVANGTIVLYHEAFVQNDLTEMTNKIYEKTTRIITDFQTWNGALGFASGFFIGAGN